MTVATKRQADLERAIAIAKGVMPLTPLSSLQTACQTAC
jgi:hypothetical protein